MENSLSNRADFELGDWRQSREFRRELVRLLVLEIALAAADADATIDELKRKTGYSFFSQSDQDNFRQMTSAIRRIASGWQHPIGSAAGIYRRGVSVFHFDKGTESEWDPLD